jgi:transposase-like protein
MDCPTCKKPMELRHGMFYSRKAGTMAGYVCEDCNSLWDDPENSFLDANRNKKATEGA